MVFQVNIAKRLAKGKRCFDLCCSFATGDSAVALFGPSGSGKSLTLRAIAGLLTPDSGRIAIDGEVLFDAEQRVNMPARMRRVGYVFQHYALMPHLTVRQNVAFGLKRLFRPLDGQGRRMVDDLLELFGLAQVAEALPRDISGGQQQRTALARALAPEPRLLLLDEPFSALDQPLRVRMQQELARLLAGFSIPLVLVTHDPAEAAFFAQTVFVLHKGRVNDLVCIREVRDQGRTVAETICARVEAAYNG